jgi:hypothetical protein
MFDQVEAFFKLLDRFKGFLARKRQPAPQESVAGRFFRLFEAHGVHRNQIPRFFGHGIQLRDVQDETTLMSCLTDAHLADACQLFGVQRQWLERGDGNAHANLLFYLQPKKFGEFLDELLARINEPNSVVIAKLFCVTHLRRGVDSLLLVPEPIGVLNDETIYRYHYVDCGPLAYWKARVSTATLLAQSINRDVCVRGYACEVKGEHWVLTDKDLVSAGEHDTLSATSKTLAIENWLLDPAHFLDGLDPERNNYGVLSGLSLWLSEDAKGLMKTYQTRPDTRLLFEAALASKICPAVANHPKSEL